MPKISISNKFFDYSELNIWICLKSGFCCLVLMKLYRQTQNKEVNNILRKKKFNCLG